MRKIIFTNRKGGCGKTTVTVNLGVALGLLQKKVLIVDLDSQSHSTFYLGLNPYLKRHNLYEYLNNEKLDIVSLITKTQFKNVWIVPSSTFLGELNIGKIKNIETRLMHDFEKITDFDFVLFDTSPSLDKFTIAGIISASEVMIPVEMHYLPMQGLAQLIREIYKINLQYKNKQVVSGIIPTLYHKRTKIYKAILEELKKIFPENIIFEGIAYDIKLAEAPSHQKPIFYYAPTSRASIDFQRLALRVLKNNK